MFVLDVSVALSWCLEDETIPDTDPLLDRLGSEEAVVPEVWPLEVGNALLSAARRGRVSAAEVTRLIGLLARLPVRVDPTRTDLTEVVRAGQQHELSTYDASYLVLAGRRGLALATLDARLAAASRLAGVPLLLPDVI